MVNQLEMLYEGKAKKIYATDKEDMVIVHYKDDATAFNGEKKAQIESKGVLNNEITSLIFEMLNKEGIKTHFVEKLNDRDQLCKKVEIVPLEVIVRNVAAGSMAKRLGLEEGYELKTTVFELSYKDDSLGDPLINDYHAVGIGATTFEELNKIYEITAKVNEILKEAFKKQNINLIDFKLEFGRYRDATTGEKMDKDRFRRDMGNVINGYREVLNRLRN